MAKKILALDIGAANLALAEYASGANGALTLVNYGIAALAAPIDSGDARTILSTALSEICREKGIKPGPVAISVSGQMVFPRFAAIPFAGGQEKFNQMVRFEIEQNVPFPIDEMVYDSQVLGDTEGGDKSVMIVAAKIDQVEAITDALAAAGFEPTLVDVAPIALTNALKAVGAETNGPVIMLDIGAKTTSLVITDGEKGYNRSIPIAGNTISKEIAQTLGCTVEEAEAYKRESGYVGLGGVVEDENETADRISKVCRAVLTRLLAEVSRSVNFYRSQQGGDAPVKLYLTGGTALLPQLDRFFAESLQVEVAYFNPFDFVTPGAALDPEALGVDAAMIAATAGVALHATGQARLDIDLMPPTLIAARAERAKVPVLAAAGVLLVVATGLMYFSGGRSSETAESVLTAVNARAAKVQAMDSQRLAAEKARQEAEASAGVLMTNLAARATAVTRLNAVRGALAPGMWIDRWEPGLVTIRGWNDELQRLVKADAAKHDGKSRQPDEIFVAALKASPHVASAKTKQTQAFGESKSKTDTSPEILQFTVELKFK